MISKNYNADVFNPLKTNKLETLNAFFHNLLIFDKTRQRQKLIHRMGLFRLELFDQKLIKNV